MTKTKKLTIKNSRYNVNLQNVGRWLDSTNKTIIIDKLKIEIDGNYSLSFSCSNVTSHNGYADLYIRNVKVDTTFQRISKIGFEVTHTTGLTKWAEIGITDMKEGEYELRLEYKGTDIFFSQMKMEKRHESIRSFYLSNWKNMIAIWKNNKLAKNDKDIRIPAIHELRVAPNWEKNLIKEYLGVFRDETKEKYYVDGVKLDAEAYFSETGELITNYLKYKDVYVQDIRVNRDYFMLPYQNVLLTRYQVLNFDEKDHDVSILDILNPNSELSDSISAKFVESLDAILIDMKLTEHCQLALGMLGEKEYEFQVGNIELVDPDNKMCSPHASFEKDGILKRNEFVDTSKVSIGFKKKMTVKAESEMTLYCYLAVAQDETSLTEICKEIKTKDGDAWVAYEHETYSKWLQGEKGTVKQSKIEDEDLQLMYQRSLVMIKNSIRPGESDEDGALPATTNMYAKTYDYKIWARDAATTMVAMDAAGFHAEGERFWRWMAKHQLTETCPKFYGSESAKNNNVAGAFYTCMNLWDNSRVEFVEPEHDSIGWFLYGIYRHCVEKESYDLANDLWTQIAASAQFIMNNMKGEGFGPADISIWEDKDKFGLYTYTQALYVAGLEATVKLAVETGRFDFADLCREAASNIKSAINRDDTEESPGLWNAKGMYYNRRVIDKSKEGKQNEADQLLDAAAMILFVLGVVDAKSGRTDSTIKSFEEKLGHAKYGMARYAADVYYSGVSEYSPAGDEVFELCPSWPQMSCWNAIVKCYNGEENVALEILKWIKNRTGVGFMATGECVNDITEKPVVSTSSEPVTAGAFVLACLTYDKKVDMRVLPEVSKAGAYKTVDITGGENQYGYVPYYCGVIKDELDAKATLERVYVSNDDKMLYLCITSNISEDIKQYQCTVYCSAPRYEGGKLDDKESTISCGGKKLFEEAAFAFSYPFNQEKKCEQKFIVDESWKNQGGDDKNYYVSSDGNKEIMQIQIPLESIKIHNLKSGEVYLMIYLEKEDACAVSHVNLNYKKTESGCQWVRGDFALAGDKKREHKLSGKDSIYMVLTDRFYDGDPNNNGSAKEYRSIKPEDKLENFRYRQGGDWKGLTDHLDYIEKLGMTAIWISPVQKNMLLSKNEDEAAYHGYFTQDYSKVDEHFGTDKELDDLIEAAHEKKIKVILDAVPNHTGDFLDPFANAYKDDNKPAWPFDNPAWYHHNGTIINYDDPWELVNCDMGGLDDLAQEKQEVSDALIDAYIKWKKRGFDAIRVDAAGAMPKTFLREFEAKLDVDTFGEIFHGDVNVVGQYQKCQWGVLDFPLFYALQDVFAKEIGCWRLTEILELDNKYMEPNNLITFIDNHDRDRFLAVVENDYAKLRMALTFIFTVRGIPCVYYGTEQNLYGYGKRQEPEIANIYNREMMKREDIERDEKDQCETYKFIQRLAEIRTLCPAIQEGAQNELHNGEDGTTYAFSRRIASTGDEAIVVMNNGYVEKTVKVYLLNESSLTKGRSLRDLLNKDINIKIEGESALYLEVKLLGKTTAIFYTEMIGSYKSFEFSKTKIQLLYREKEGESISLVGNRYPLAWNKTRPARKVSDGVWEFENEGLNEHDEIEFVPMLNKKIRIKHGDGEKEITANVAAKGGVEKITGKGSRTIKLTFPDRK